MLIRAIFFITLLSSLMTVQVLMAHNTNIPELKRKRVLNLSLGSINFILALSLGPLLGLLSTHTPSWIEIFIGVLVLDFVAYAFHRVFHQFNILFRFHGVHHSDPHIEVTSALRFHFGEVIVGSLARVATVWLTGFSYQTLIAFELVFMFFNMLQHANLRLPQPLSRLLGWIFITPAFHRRHHSVQVTEMNSNYGTIFSFWDRIFGTFTPSKEDDQFLMGLKSNQKEMKVIEAIRWPFKRH